MVKSLNAATRANKIGIFVQASAAIIAKRMGKIIPGNVVVELYRTDFVVWLKASVRAVISAPIWFYIAEDPGTGKATLTAISDMVSSRVISATVISATSETPSSCADHNRGSQSSPATRTRFFFFVISTAC